MIKTAAPKKFMLEEGRDILRYSNVVYKKTARCDTRHVFFFKNNDETQDNRLQDEDSQ